MEEEGNGSEKEMRGRSVAQKCLIDGIREDQYWEKREGVNEGGIEKKNAFERRKDVNVK